MVYATLGRYHARLCLLKQTHHSGVECLAVFIITKASSVPLMVEEFGHMGLGQWFRYFTGSLELLGALLILLPSFASFGEEKLLRAARMYESATDWHARRPKV